MTTVSTLEDHFPDWVNETQRLLRDPRVSRTVFQPGRDRRSSFVAGFRLGLLYSLHCRGVSGVQMEDPQKLNLSDRLVEEEAKARLSARARNVLANYCSGMTMADLCLVPVETMWRWRNCGKLTVQEIQGWLLSTGLISECTTVASEYKRLKKRVEELEEMLSSQQFHAC